jgi:hypothetical protein
VKLAVALVALCGCNDLLSLDPGTPLDPEQPSCLTGWQQRVRIDIVNDGPTALTDYQVQVSLRARGDLRIVDGSGALLRYAGEGATVWVSIPDIPTGTSHLDAYYENPDAPPWAGETPFVEGVLANHSFENAGGWNRDPADEVEATFQRTSAWATDGVDSMFADEEVSGTRIRKLRAAITQQATFAPGASYAVRFDLHVIAASYSITQTPTGPLYDNGGSFFIDLGNGLDPIWKIVAHGNITGVHLGEETGPIGPGITQIRFGTEVQSGSGNGYAKGYVDNFRVRKVATPAPVVQVGAVEDACN